MGDGLLKYKMNAVRRVDSARQQLEVNIGMPAWGENVSCWGYVTPEERSDE